MQLFVTFFGDKTFGLTPLTSLTSLTPKKTSRAYAHYSG